MESSFYVENRRALLARMEHSLAVVFSGEAPRKTNDEYYPFFTNRNFIYLTGIDQCDATLLLAATGNGGTNGPNGADTAGSETLFIPPSDLIAERWTGTRVKGAEASAISGVKDIQFTNAFSIALDRALLSGEYSAIYLPLYKHAAGESDGPEYRLVRYLSERFPHIVIKDLMPHLKALRLIKKPCEIAAMREAQKDTREGILAMMRASRPGMMEYEYKAEFDYALMKRGVLTPAFPSIISAGKNNFSIHYHSYTGQAQDGDMVLNDVGAWRDNLMTDVSRGWPCNGRFSERQRLLYQCAFDCSNHMFGVIKPGMLQGEVVPAWKHFTYERLRDIGLCKSFDDIGTYMWHGGDHHVGFDVHDVVAVTPATPLAPGMVFSVDIGIYCEEWGIGFRLEDDCLVTEGGCENLSRDTPRSIEEIEAVMA